VIFEESIFPHHKEPILTPRKPNTTIPIPIPTLVPGHSNTPEIIDISIGYDSNDEDNTPLPPTTIPRTKTPDIPDIDPKIPHILDIPLPMPPHDHLSTPSFHTPKKEEEEISLPGLSRRLEKQPERQFTPDLPCILQKYTLRKPTQSRHDPENVVTD
jgi:hypothetical protein